MTASTDSKKMYTAVYVLLAASKQLFCYYIQSKIGCLKIKAGDPQIVGVFGGIEIALFEKLY